MSVVRLVATVDRIEGEYAVLLLPAGEQEVAVDWPVDLLPSGVQEGSKIKFSLSRDEDEEAAARQRVADLLRKLTEGTRE
ncbi:MAG: DUF3006 domain-containing protein [Firmicutes bacterium]|jgi:hypothetical protein|nr:DUF3006 domain-containing protein [Bacillota bacterium]